MAKVERGTARAANSRSSGHLKQGRTESAKMRKGKLCASATNLKRQDKATSLCLGRLEAGGHQGSGLSHTQILEPISRESL